MSKKWSWKDLEARIDRSRLADVEDAVADALASVRIALRHYRHWTPEQREHVWGWFDAAFRVASDEAFFAGPLLIRSASEHAVEHRMTAATRYASARAARRRQRSGTSTCPLN